MENNIYPVVPAPNAMTVSTIQPTQVTVSQSMRRQVNSLGTHRFAFKLGYAPLSREQYNVVRSFLAAQRGRYETFLFKPHTIGNSAGKTKTNVRVASEVAAGVSRVPVYGVDAPLVAGDLVRFGGQAKGYEVVAASEDHIDIVPPLMHRVRVKERVLYQDVHLTCALAEDKIDAQRDLNGNWHLKVTLVEVVS